MLWRRPHHNLCIAPLVLLFLPSLALFLHNSGDGKVMGLGGGSGARPQTPRVSPSSVAGFSAMAEIVTSSGEEEYQSPQQQSEAQQQPATQGAVAVYV